MDLAISRKFRGLYDTGRSQPDPQGLASRFSCIRPRADDRIRYATAEYVIRDKGSLRDFIDRVPEKEMQHVPNPEPSDDPILQRPEIDFENHMLLAIVSHEPNRFVALDVEKVELTSETMRVFCRYSSSRTAATAPSSYVDSTERSSSNGGRPLDECQLLRVLRRYVAYYNRTRTHLALGKDPPEPRPVQGSDIGAHRRSP